MRVRRVDAGQDPAPLPGLLAGRNSLLPSCLSVQTAPIWEWVLLPCKPRASPPIRQAKWRAIGSAISVFPIAAFLYPRECVGPSLSACACRKQTGCAERSSSSFRSSRVPAHGLGQLTLGTRCAGFCRSATGCSAGLLQCHCFSGGGIALGCCGGDSPFLGCSQT